MAINNEKAMRTCIFFLIHPTSKTCHTMHLHILTRYSYIEILGVCKNLVVVSMHAFFIIPPYKSAVATPSLKKREGLIIDSGIWQHFRQIMLHARAVR